MGAICDKTDPKIIKLKKFLQQYDSFYPLQFENKLTTKVDKVALSKGYEIKISEQISILL